MNPDINTNPFSRDTDGDRIIDGYELENISLLGIPAGEWIGILHSTDYDGDGIPDSYEIRTQYWEYINNRSAWNNNLRLNPANRSDAYEDFDSDGLTNLEEYQRDPPGNYDSDTKPDIYDSDDDNDGIPTSVELQYHLDPFNPDDANGDLDHDGLTNLFEYNNSLNMNDPDTDHDGINDGDELNYWNITRGLDMDTSVEYCKIPDVDGDNITDGKEIKGYSVKIITGWKSDGTPISVMRELKSDPLIPYGYNDSSDNFHWSDSDWDGIPDVVESMLSNSSYFLTFYHFTHKDDWMKEEREKLWEDYNWTISYYFSLKLHKNYDKIYSDIENNPEYYIKHYNSLSPHNQSCGENASKYLTSQFNPFVVENMPPVIVKFNVNFSYYGVTAKMDIYAIVRDAGAIKKIKLIDSDLGQSVEWNNIHKRVIYISHTFWATPWGANLGANITVKTWDDMDNYAKMSRDVYGPAGTLIKMFLEWLAPFFKWLVKIGKIMMKALNAFLQWIISMVRDAVNTLLGPLINAYESWQSDLINTIKEGWEEYNDTGKISDSTLSHFNNLLGGSFFWILMGISVGLMALSLTLNALTFGSISIISMVIAPIVTLAILQVFSVTQEKKVSLDLSGLTLSVDAIWNFVVGLITGRSGARTTVRDGQEESSWLEVAALFFKYSAVFGEWISILIADLIGEEKGAIGFIAGSLSILFASAGIWTNMIYHDKGLSKILSTIAIVSGIIGLFATVGNWFLEGEATLVEILIASLGATGIVLATAVLLSGG